MASSRHGPGATIRGAAAPDQAPCPALTCIKRAAEPGTHNANVKKTREGGAMFNTILTATDGSESARRALKMAAGLAAAHDASVIVMHVLGEGEVPESLRHMAEVEHLVEPEHLSNSQVANLATGLSLSVRAETAAHLARVHDAVGERLLANARQECEEAGAKRVQTVKEAGDPARAIVRVAAERGADLVVLGTRGLSDLKGMLLGSVSHRVIQLAKCPCLTVH